MHLSKDVLNELAKLAADSFLKHKTSLNTSLAKTAKEEALEPHQIEYVAAQANHAVWSRLHGMDKKASYDFPVADPEAVIKTLQVKPVIVKQASDDYYGAPTGSTGFTEKTASINLDSVDKTAAKRRELKKALQSRLEKCANAKEELQRKMTVIESKYELTERDLMKQARSLLMEQPFELRGEAMSKIADAIYGACEDKKLSRDLMKKLSAVVGSQGLIKKADLKAPEAYISENLPARIVNGRHALYITIQTLKNLRTEYEPLQRGYEIVDSSLPELREKVRAL